MDAPETPPRRPGRRQQASPQAKDPVIGKVIQLPTFEDDYSTEDFIGNLSEHLIASSKAEPGPFNPKPFIDTFSPALDQLLALRSQVAERTRSMEGEVRRANREYGKRLRELDSGFEAVGSSFSSLENKITDVGRTAAKIGEQLESLHQVRSTAQATSLLVGYYISLAQYTATTGEEKSPLAQLYSTRKSPEGRQRLAVVLRRLMAVAKDVADTAATALADAEAVDANGESHTAAHRNVLLKRGEKEKADRVAAEIEKFCERFEQEVLTYFNRAFKKGDPRNMGHCAKVLQDFNGGTSCVQVYVNQHDFFISKDRLIENALEEAEANGTAVEIWKTIGDPSLTPPTSEPGLAALFKEIRTTVSQEAQIVLAVFPNPTAVMQVFLQRVFAQVIQQHIESLVSRASTVSTLAILRILHLSHSMCAKLVEDLKSLDVTLGGPVAGSSKLAAAPTGPIATLLDQSLEEIFIPWLEGSRYLDSESKNLVELYGGLLSQFTHYHETVLKAKPNSLMNRVVNQLSTSGGGTTNTTAQVASSAAQAIGKYANLFASSAQNAISGSKTPNSNAPTPPPRSTSRLSMQLPGLPTRQNSYDTTLEKVPSPEDGILDIELAERMMRWHAEAIGRVVELCSPAEVAKNVFALSKVLAEAIGRSFIDTALDSALARLEQYDGRADPDLSVLTVLRPADLVCHLWQRYTSTALLPLATSPAVRREMSTFNQHNTVRMENKANAVLQKAVDVIVLWLSYLLTKQKRNDYKPKNDEMSFARTNTEPCELCCEFLAQVHVTATSALSGKNLDALLTEVGVSFHSLLLDHYKKFPVNPTGGLMLTKDLATYQECIAAFNSPQLNDRFEMLRQLGNCFIVQPDVLRTYMTESHLGRIDSRLLRPYLQQRSDWSQFARQFSDTEEIETASVAAPMFLGRQASKRLSAMGGAAGAAMGGMAGAGMAGMQKLRDALKDFENMTEKAHNESSGPSTPSIQRSASSASSRAPPPSTWQSQGANRTQPFVYMGMP